MVAAQTCIQLSFSFMGVQSVRRFLRHCTMVKYTHYRALANNFFIREYVTNMNNSGLVTPYPSRAKCIRNVSSLPLTCDS